MVLLIKINIVLKYFLNTPIWVEFYIFSLLFSPMGVKQGVSL